MAPLCRRSSRRRSVVAAAPSPPAPRPLPFPSSSSSPFSSSSSSAGGMSRISSSIVNGFRHSGHGGAPRRASSVQRRGVIPRHHAPGARQVHAPRDARVHRGLHADAALRGFPGHHLVEQVEPALLDGGVVQGGPIRARPPAARRARRYGRRLPTSFASLFACCECAAIASLSVAATASAESGPPAPEYPGDAAGTARTRRRPGAGTRPGARPSTSPPRPSSPPSRVRAPAAPPPARP